MCIHLYTDNNVYGVYNTLYIYKIHTIFTTYTIYRHHHHHHLLLSSSALQQQQERSTITMCRLTLSSPAVISQMRNCRGLNPCSAVWLRSGDWDLVRPGIEKPSIFFKIPFKKHRFWEPGWVGSGRGSKNHRFSLKFLLKNIDFESRAGSGGAGDQKINDFLLNSF